MASTGVKIEGLEELQRKLRDPRTLKDPTNKILFRARKAGLNAAREPLSNAGTGLAHRSISASFSKKTGIVRIFSRMPLARAKSIEEGTRPGTNVPLRRLIRWRMAVNHRLYAEQLREMIRMRGSEGLGFMANAVKTIEGNLPRYIADAIREIERQWAKGA